MIKIKYHPILGIRCDYDGERPEAQLISTVNPRQQVERFNNMHAKRVHFALMRHNLKKK